MIPFTGNVMAHASPFGWVVSQGGAILKGPAPKAEILKYIRETLQCRRIDP
jgi:hypothetical protein